MPRFYTSEILLLPQSYSSEELQQLATQHLQQQLPELTATNITFLNPELENFSIDQVRQLLNLASYGVSSQQSAGRAFVLCQFDTASLEAQNAALKIIEEPPAHTYILILAKNRYQLLDTIISRCQVTQGPTTQTGLADNTSNSGLAASSTAVNFTWPNSIGAAIQLATTHKDRDQASELLEYLLQSPTTPTSYKALLLRAHQDLAGNANVQLALEHCFLQLYELENQAHQR